MGKKLRKNLSICLSLAIAAAAMPASGLNTVVENLPGVQKIGEKGTTANAADDILNKEVFTTITIDKENGCISADGRNVGRSYGGVSMVGNGEITINVDGRVLTLSQAEKEIGCVVRQNVLGETLISSPFQTARLIVRADKNFNNCGAESVEEKFDGLYLLKYGSVTEAYKAYKVLSEDENIEYVEPDSICQALENDSAESFDIDSWGKDEIGTEEYCKRIKEEKGELPVVKVAVVDTGIYAEHEMFKGRILDGGKSFVSGTELAPIDEHGHGTHCAGIVCQSTNDNVKILPVRVLSAEGYGTDLDIYSGIRYAVEQGVDIISVSIGGYGKSRLFDEAVYLATSKGITICIANGNESMNSYETNSSLSAIEDAVVVSSVGASKNLSTFSNYGITTDFAAPGEDINSAGLEGVTDTVKMTGTSMATPFVAGCFADVLSYDINYTSEELYALIKANAVDICDPGFDELTGWGLVNLKDFHFDAVRVNKPAVDICGGFFEEPVEISLSCDTEGAEIYYTLDGSKPDVKKSKKYDGKPIKLEKSTRIRAISCYKSIVSAETTEYYAIEEETSDSFLIENGVLMKYSGSYEVVDLPAMIKLGTIPQIKEIAPGAFSGCESLTEIILPDNIKSIPAYAFSRCNSLSTIKTSAVEIGDHAFEECSSLITIDSPTIKAIGSGAFDSAYALSEADFKGVTEIPTKAFKDCMSITGAMFDFSKVVDFGNGCFMNSSLDGEVDASNAKKIGIAVFNNTQITGITFPKDFEKLPERILLGCTELTKISAPAVTKLDSEALALDKASRTELSCDIDFSKMTEVGESALRGFVFEKPVSFDSLDEYTQINVIEDAFGDEVSFPTIKEVSGGFFAVSIFDFSDMFGFDSFGSNFNVDVIRLENATRIDESSFGKFNILVLGDKVKELNLNASSGMVVTAEENEKIKAQLEGTSVQYSTMPAIYVPEEKVSVYVGEEEYIHAYSLGNGGGAGWCVYDEEIKSDVVLTDEPVNSIRVNTEKAGEYKYTFRLFDKKNNVLNSKEILVEVVEPEVRPIAVNSLLELKGVEFLTNSNGDNFLKYQFIPEKTGNYVVNTGNVEIDITCDGNDVLNAGSNYYNCCYVELEEGKVYDVRVKVDEFASFFEPKSLWFSIRTDDDEQVFIGNLYDCKVDWSGFDGSAEFKPEITINDGEYQLVEGVDFVLELDDDVDYGNNHFAIRGIGKYYGTLKDEDVYLRRTIKADNEYLLTSEDIVSFIPEKSGCYNFVMKPTDEQIENAKANKSPVRMDEFSPLPTVYVEETTDMFGFEMVTQTFLTPEMGGLGKGYTYTADHSVVSIVLEEGKEYVISNDECDVNMTITAGDTLFDCKAEYKTSYEWNGKAVTPEVTVTGKNGEKLVEGKDYDFEYWGNDAEGIMFAYINGHGKYPGAKALCMTVGDSVLKPSMEFGNIAFEMPINREVPVYPTYNYIINIDEPTLLAPVVPEGEEVPEITFVDVNDPMNGAAFINELMTTAYLMPGKYVIDFSLTDEPCTSIMLSTDVKYTNVSDALISYTSPVYNGEVQVPEFTVMLGGEILVEGEDYIVEYSEESVEVGVYEAVIIGIGDYTGEFCIEYEIVADEGDENPDDDGEFEGFPVLKDGKNVIEFDEESVGVYEWTPEHSRYLVTLPSYRTGYISISTNEGEIICESELHIKYDAVVDTVPGETYYVTFNPTACDTYELNFISTGIFSDCVVKSSGKIVHDKNAVPDVQFYDAENDYTLVEGVDYELVCSGYYDAPGRHDYVYRGLGKYTGELTVPFIAYPEKLPESDNITQLRLGFIGDAGTMMSGKPGERTFFSFTSEIEGETAYKIINRNMLNMPTQNTGIMVYDSNGDIIGVNDEIADITLNKGETIYIVVANPIYSDSSDTIMDAGSNIRVELAEKAPETTTASTSATTENTTTTTVTTAPESSETNTTSTDKDTTSTDKGTTTTTTAPETGEGTSTTTAPDGELPETGYSKWYDIAAAVSAAMVAVGAAFVVSAKRKEDEE